MRVYSCLDYEPKKKRRRIEYEANGIAKHSTEICVIVTFGHFLVIKRNSVIDTSSTLPSPPFFRFATLSDFRETVTFKHEQSTRFRV